MERLDTLDRRMRHLNKMQRIEFALHNTDKFSFWVNHRAFQLSMIYYSAGAKVSEVTDLDSPNLVEKILYEFRADERVRLTFKYNFEDADDGVPEIELRHAINSFREALVHQIHRLTGTRPFVEWGASGETGNLSIWFSREDYLESLQHSNTRYEAT